MGHWLAIVPSAYNTGHAQMWQISKWHYSGGQVTLTRLVMVEVK